MEKLVPQTWRKGSEVELTLRVFITVGAKLGWVRAPRFLALGIDLEIIPKKKNAKQNM